MSWVTVLWSMTAAACLTLAGVHLLIWFKQRQAWGGLLFSITALSTAALAFCELWMMHAETAVEFGRAVRWMHVPVAVLIVALIAFVRVQLHAGRPWLAWAACAVRVFSLLLNFFYGQNLNYLEVTVLRRVPFLGEPVSVGEGVSNPAMIVGQLSLLLFAIFVIDATMAVWRRGDRRQALAIGGSIVFFVLVASVQGVLAFWQIVHAPFIGSLFFIPVVAAMGYEMSRDVLRAAQLSEDLRESEERMTLAVEAAGFGIWMWSVPHNRIWGSARWRHLFGFAPEAVVRFDQVMARIHPDDREDVRRDAQRALADRIAYAREYRLVLPDGTARWIATRGRMAPDVPGKPARMLGATIDITERKQAEADALRQRTELAHLSRVTMLGELSGSIAHELNQPLTAILSNAQAAKRFLAQEPVDLDELRDILTDIVEQDQRAGEVIHRLRLLLKKGEVQQQPMDVNEVVQDGLKLIRSDLLNQSVAAHTELAPALASVSGDRVQLQQVLVNLVMNASDAMSGNAPHDRQLIVRTEPLAGGGARVSVSDAGAGIAPDQLEQVFEPFFSTKTLGLGLGLSVCRSIVAAHGGMLWATHNPQRGATFHFTLPVAGGAKS
jgi:PAS domain S-box-containing protein